MIPGKGTNLAQYLTSGHARHICGPRDALHIHVLNRDIPFMFMDTYPDLNVWAAATTALDSEAASELEDMFSTVSECSKNSLWKFEASE